MKCESLFTRSTLGIVSLSKLFYQLGVTNVTSDLDRAGETVDMTLNPARLVEKSNMMKQGVTDPNLLLGTNTVTRFLFDKIADLGVINTARTPNGFIFKENLMNVGNILKRSAMWMPLSTDIVPILENQGKCRLAQLGDASQGGKWKKVDTSYMDDTVKSGYLATWEYLNHGFVMLISEGTRNGETIKHRKLATKSMDIIRRMCEMGLILPKKGQNFVDVNDIYAKLNPASDKANLLEGKTAMFCIEWQPSLHKYEYTIKSKCELDAMYMLPLIEAEAVYMYLYMSVANKTGFAEIRYNNTDGVQVHKFAATKDSMEMWYRDIVEPETKGILARKFDSNVIGLDPNSLRFRFFDIESSVHGGLVRTIKPGEIEHMCEANPKAVDISAHDLDYNLISLVFHARVNRMTRADFDAISKVIPTNAPTVRAKKQEILQWQANQRPDDLYRTLIYPDAGIQSVFGNNLKAAMARRKNYMPRYLKNFKPIDFAEVRAKASANGVSVEAVLQDIMLQGVLHATVYSSTGSVRETYLTNNVAILEAVYGKNYVALYGSRRARMYAVKKILLENASMTVNDVLDILSDYGIDDYAVWHIYAMYQKSFANIKALLEQNGVRGIIPLIDAEITKLAEGDIDHIKMVTGYKVNAYSLVRSNGEVSLYDCFNTSNIVGLEYSEKVTAEELTESAKNLGTN